MEETKNITQEIYLVLQKIKEHSGFSRTKNEIRYEIDLLPQDIKTIPPQEEYDILKTLQNKKIVTIKDMQITLDLHAIFKLEIIEPDFSTLLQTMKILSCRQDFSPEIIEHKDIKIEMNRKHKSLSFPKYYLMHEINNFKIILKYLVRSELLKQKNYKYIINILNSLNSFLEDVLEANYNDWFLDNLEIKSLEKCPVLNEPEQKINPDLIASGEQRPLPITGEIKITGLSEGLKALSTTQSDNTIRFPYKIPAGTQWHNIIIKFIDDETIEIHVKKLRHTANYKEMGMVGKGKSPAPNEQWNFLKVLAQCFGEITIKDPEAKDKYKKQKQELSETLRAYFSIDYDPFYPYQSGTEKRGNSYKIKMLLIPPPPKKEPANIDNDDDPLGIKEFLNETTSSII